MPIRLAKKTGFCFGVKRAVTMAEAALKDREPIYSLGSIIHNRQVVEGLSRRGLKVISDARLIKKGRLVIASHGISPKVAKAIAARGVNIIDATCPFVLNAQKIARRLSGEGYEVVIVGDAGHPEVKALVDFAPKRVYVVKDEKEARALKLKKGRKISVISQTTQSTENFLAVVGTILESKPKEIRIFNTICKDAEERQALAKELAGRVGLMLVVGGRDSANTRRLYEVCKKVLNNSHLIETEKDLRRSWLKPAGSVGITSGASTPEWLVKRVVHTIERLHKVT